METICSRWRFRSPGMVTVETVERVEVLNAQIGAVDSTRQPPGTWQTPGGPNMLGYPMVQDHIKAHAKLGAMIAPETGYCLVSGHHPDGSHIVRTLVTDPINGTCGEMPTGFRPLDVVVPLWPGSGVAAQRASTPRSARHSSRRADGAVHRKEI